MKNSGVFVVAGLRVTKNQAGGSPYVCFTTRDAFNSVEYSNQNTLMVKRQIPCCIYSNGEKDNEDDIYYDFEVDLNLSLCSIF